MVFLEGHFHRIKRLTPNEEDFVKYHVSMRDGEFDAVFYKNKQLDKWWMEIPLVGEQADTLKIIFLFLALIEIIKLLAKESFLIGGGKPSKR